MSAAATTQQENISTAVAEAVFATGNLKDLKPAQRVEYMQSACRALGLNPLTRPFRFLELNGQVQLYATKDCADQLRRLHKINLHVVDRSIDGDLYTVTVRARTPDGREDEDMGAVNLGLLKGEARANQIMKAITKAKRRVTMSICGLGFLDETEVDTIPGAHTFDAEADPRQDVVVHGKRPMPPLVRAEEPFYPPRQTAAPAAQPGPLTQFGHELVEEKRETAEAERRAKWHAKFRASMDGAETAEEVEAILRRDSVKHARENWPLADRRMIEDLIKQTYDRLSGIFSHPNGEPDDWGNAPDSPPWPEEQEPNESDESGR